MNRSTMASPVGPRWRKSSYSGPNGQCVEVARPSVAPSTVAVRDSKDPSGPSLAFSAGAWTAFLDEVKAAGLVR